MAVSLCFQLHECGLSNPPGTSSTVEDLSWFVHNTCNQVVLVSSCKYWETVRRFMCSQHTWLKFNSFRWIRGRIFCCELQTNTKGASWPVFQYDVDIPNLMRRIIGYFRLEGTLWSFQSNSFTQTQAPQSCPVRSWKPQMETTPPLWTPAPL